MLRSKQHTQLHVLALWISTKRYIYQRSRNVSQPTQRNVMDASEDQKNMSVFVMLSDNTLTIMEDICFLRQHVSMTTNGALSQLALLYAH